MADDKLKSYLDQMPQVNPSPTGIQSANTNEEPDACPSPGMPIPKAAPPPARAIKIDPKRQTTRIFLATLGILQTVKAIGVLLRARRYVLSLSNPACPNPFMSRSTRSLRRALAVFLKALFKIERTNIKSSIFFSAYPALYRLLTTHRPSANPPSFLITAGPALLLGPLANLLPGNILTQLNLYATCAAGLACARVLDARVRAGLDTWETSLDRRQGQGKTEGYVPYFMNPDRHFSFLDRPPSARRLSSTALTVAKATWTALSSGGGWWLFPLTQGLLLDTAVFEGDCFPGSYRSVIVSVSPVRKGDKRRTC